MLLVASSAIFGTPQPPEPMRLEPKVSFTLHEEERRSPDQTADDADSAEGLVAWRTLARKAASLQQLDCTEDLLGATQRMVDEAEAGNSLAMAALGVMCTHTRDHHPLFFFLPPLQQR